MGLFFLSALAMLGHRLMAIHRGERDLRVILQDDMWLVSALFLLSSLSIKRSLWVVSASTALTALLMHFIPGSELLFSISLFTSLLLAGGVLR